MRILDHEKEGKMLRRKALILFAVVAAIIALFAYTNAIAADCVALQGFEICTADPFYRVDLDNNVSFNYAVKRTSLKNELLSFIDILIPGSVDIGCSGKCLLENWNCLNIETRFDGQIVNNVTYDLKQGTPLSRFGAGISDKRALRAIIGKQFTGSKAFSVKFKNQASLPKSGFAYLQVTKPINKYDSAKYRGPDGGTTEDFADFGQAIYEEVKLTMDEDGQPISYIIDHLQQKVYDSRSPTVPLEGKLITGMTINFRAGPSGDFTGFLDVKNITNKALFDGGDNSCYPYCYNGRYYNICVPPKK